MRRRPPATPEQLLRRVQQSMTPGSLGVVASAHPVQRTSSSSVPQARGGAGLHVGASAPTDPEATPFWLDTDESC